MDDRTMIEQALEREMMSVREWRETIDGEVEAVIGRYQITEDDEDAGLYEGDEGELVATVVGAEEYRNRRVWFGFKGEHHEDPLDVNDLTILDPID